MKKIEYNIPVYEDEDMADLKDYSEKMALALKEQVDKFGNPLTFISSVQTYEELEQIENAENGNIYGVIDKNKNYIWNGIEWMEYSNIIGDGDDNVIVTPTEPTGIDRKKVWMQNNEIDNKIYVKNDNDVYETFMKEDVTEGIQISNNTRNHTNQYLKIFSVDMQNENYKANSVLFKLSCVQGGQFDILYNLQIYRETASNGITRVELKEINKMYNTINLSENLVAILEKNNNMVSLYMKITSATNTPKIKILSYQKHKTEELTIYSEQYLDTLPFRNTI